MIMMIKTLFGLGDNVDLAEKRLHVPFSYWTTTATGFFEESRSVLTIESPTESSIEDPVAVNI